MKIAIVINTSWNVYNYRKGLIEAFLEKGWEVIAIAPPDPYSSKLEELGCSFVPIKMENKGMNPLSDLLLTVRFFRLYKKIRPDWILHYTIKPNVYGTLAATVLHIPCVSNVSGLGTAFIRRGILMHVAKGLYRFAFRFPKRVLFQNPDDRDLFVSLKLLQNEQTALLPGSGINLDAYQPRQIGPWTSFVFVLIARLLTDKGIREYAAASKKLKAEGHVFIAQLVGFFDRESPYNISLEEINDWQSNGVVDFLGQSEHIHANIEAAHCVVLPSYREGTPRSLLEAMALGRPIITTNVPGCKEVIIDGGNGFVCEARDADGLASAMRKMMTLPLHKLREMGEKGRKLVEEKFDEKLVIDKYFNEILGK